MNFKGNNHNMDKHVDTEHVRKIHLYGTNLDTMLYSIIAFPFHKSGIKVN